VAAIGPWAHKTADLGIDLFEELQELDRPATLVAFADDKPRGDIECGKQCGCTMPHIAVRAPFRYARHHRQDRLLPIECRDLAFLIDAKGRLIAILLTGAA
jgi:hypothetical protein